MSLQVGIFRSEVVGKDETLGLPVFDRAVTEEFLEKLFFMVYGDGVFPSPSTAFQLRAGTGLTAAIQPGALFCQGKFAYDTEAAPVTFTQNSGEQDLIARLVFRRDLPNRTGDFVVLYGTPAADPQAPELTRTADIYELGIADVLLKAGAESVTDADITDLRMDSSLCGIITGSLKITDTTEIFAQFKAIFQGLFERMESEAAELEDVIAGIEQGSEVMLRAVYDKDADGVVDEAAAVQAYTPSAAQVYAPSPPAGGEGSSAASEAFGGPVRLSVDEATGAVTLHAVKQGLGEEGEPVGEAAVEEVPVANAAALGGKTEAELSVGDSAKIGGKALSMSLSGTTLTINYG